MQTLLSVFLSLLLAFIVKRATDYIRACRATGNFPGFRILWNILGISAFVPRIPGITFGKDPVTYKHDDFAYFGCDVFTLISAWPTVQTVFSVADPDLIKTIVGSRAQFPKPHEVYKGLSFWGQNLVVSEGDEWKRHRKISAPAFSESNNKLVWKETIHVMQELFNEVWGDKEQIVLDHALHLPTMIALFVIGAAGFGKKMSWHDTDVPPPGHKMNFRDALEHSSANVPLKALVPGWILGLTAGGRKIKLAFEEIEKYMFEMVDKGKMERGSEDSRHDLFSRLIEASETELTGKKMTDREVISNIFIFLFAGHETTAHTLCFTFGLLALYPDEQEKLYQEVLKYIPGDKLPAYEEVHSMAYLTAVLNETLRMYPPVAAIPKRAAEDITLTATTHSGENVAVPMPKDSIVALNFIALHYNPKYWDNPDVFNPSRFLGDWPREAFMSFSAGARSCIGRRFAELESMVVLAMMVKNYKISVKQEPQFANETVEQTRARIFELTYGVTQTPKRVPLVFTKRV